jgi:glycosyltransferase 2 family protein
MRNHGRTVIGLLISAIFLYWALRGLDFGDFWVELQHANYWWLVPGVAVYFIGVWARTWRWHYMLRPLRRIPLRELFPIVCIGYAGNNIYPARAGEVLRAYILKRHSQIPISANLATVVVERIFDGLVMLAFVLFALPFTNFGARYNTFVIGFSALFLGALVAFLIMAARPELMQRLLNTVLTWWVPERFHARVTELAARFLEGLASLRNGRDVVMIFFTSVIVWLLETLKYWFVMHAFPFDVPFTVLMLMNGIVNLATTLPGAPGHIGTFDAPGIAVLMATGQVAQEVATSYTLVLHVALWLPITALGLYYLGKAQLSVRRVQREMALE